MLVFTLLSCHRDDPPIPHLPPSEVTSTLPTSTAPPPPPPPTTTTTTTTAACARAADFDDWPGGRTLQLHVPEALAIGSVVTIGADGAVPGQRVVFEVGSVCALDCPPDRDGACYQPVDPVLLGEDVADNQGHATISATVADWVPQGWFVFQASAPDDRALSQVVVDRLYEGPPELELYVLSPGVYRNLGGSWFAWFVAAGRRATYALHPTVEMYGYTDLVSEGEVSPATFLRGTLDVERATSLEFDAQAYWGGPYTLVADTEPLLAPILWYPDADGDGWGDPAGSTTSSTTPVAGHSADPRDCDDGDADVHPWADDACEDGRDTDCDGLDRPCTLDPSSDWTRGTSGTRYRGGHWSFAGSSLAVGDVDGDGVTDLFAAGAPAIILPIDRLDHSEAGTSLTVRGSSTDDPVLADVDGDGFDDLLSFDDHWGVTLDAGSPQGLVAPRNLLPTESPFFVELAAGDLTGDGADDVVVLVNGGPARLFTGPAWSAVADVEVEGSGEDIQVGDADGDGLDDLWTIGACVHLSPLPAAGGTPDGCVEGNWRYGVALGDANGDGTLDAVLNEGWDARVFLGPWTGTLGPGDAFASVANNTAAEAVIVEGPDPAIAVQLAEDSAVVVWLGAIGGGGALDLAAGMRLHPSTSFSKLLAEDVDGNGYDELVVGDFLAPVADRGGSGEVWVHWDAGRDL